MRLSEVKIGQKVKIVSIEENILTHKLMTLGFLEHTALTVIRKSLFGGSFYIKVENQYVALRTEELASITVIDC